MKIDAKSLNDNVGAKCGDISKILEDIANKLTRFDLPGNTTNRGNCAQKLKNNAGNVRNVKNKINKIAEEINKIVRRLY